jgi:hypothetical protein
LLAVARQIDGDVLALENDRDGRHCAIMRYNINKGVVAAKFTARGQSRKGGSNGSRHGVGGLFKGN